MAHPFTCQCVRNTSFGGNKPLLRRKRRNSNALRGNLRSLARSFLHVVFCNTRPPTPASGNEKPSVVLHGSRYFRLVQNLDASLQLFLLLIVALSNGFVSENGREKVQCLDRREGRG